MHWPAVARPVLLLYVPSGQVTSSAEAPAQYPPASHTAGSTVPTEHSKPKGHASQAVALYPRPYLPAAHGAGDVAPAAQTVPGPHGFPAE